MVVDAGEGIQWHAGLNPEGDFNAEFIRDAKDPSNAQLYLQPDRDLAGRDLAVTLTYPNGKIDSLRIKGERTDPKLAMPRPSVPKLEAAAFTGRWLGQDGSRDSNRRDVHVALSGLPAGRAIVAAILSDSVSKNWIFRSSPQVKLEVEPGERPLIFQKGNDPTKADLFFSPYRNEVGATLTLRLVFEDGESTFAQFGAGVCDPFAGLPKPAPTSVVAKPGDDLNDLANRFGTVTLAGGTHRLSKPLVLNKPVTLVGEPGAILEFSQDSNETPWTTAVKIHCGSTTLRDFAIRFAGRVRWNQTVSYGPAVIGTTDNLEPARSDPKAGLTFERLDLAGPPPSGATDWEEAVRLMRLNTAQSGSITGCTLYGGMIEFVLGPWQFVDNTYRGTPSGTFSHGVVVGHLVHDLLVRGNRIKPVGRSGKTWRFLVVTGYGHAIQVENNQVEGVGPRDDDTIPAMNAPEIILTESYSLNFEGRPSALSPDRRAPDDQPGDWGTRCERFSGLGAYGNACGRVADDHPADFAGDFPARRATPPGCDGGLDQLRIRQVADRREHDRRPRGQWIVLPRVAGESLRDPGPRESIPRRGRDTPARGGLQRGTDDLGLVPRSLSGRSVRGEHRGGLDSRGPHRRGAFPILQGEPRPNLHDDHAEKQHHPLVRRVPAAAGSIPGEDSTSRVHLRYSPFA